MFTRRYAVNKIKPRQLSRFSTTTNDLKERPWDHRLPELCAEKADGTVIKISEEDLYRYTRHRWLFNEPNELAKRHVKFNVRNLIRAAVDASKGAQHCVFFLSGLVSSALQVDQLKGVRILKCSEGLHNKAFVLTMDNGYELFAKLPNPNAGPARFTVASEVATRELLHDWVGLPVPRVLAWSCDANDNPVEAEYILEEKASGVRLGSVWKQWPRESKLRLITQVADIENTLTSVRFPTHGSVYFKNDLRRFIGKADELELPCVAPEISTRYSIGPLTSAELWNSARKDMNLDRGPWKSPCSYTKALGDNETAWINSSAEPRMNYHRSMTHQELPEDGIELLAKYTAVASYLVPLKNNEAALANVLWHPDLHLDNVFVDPGTCEITSIVDWQSASVAPLYYQSDVPRMFKHLGHVREGWVLPQRPDDFDTLKDEEKKQLDDELESETMHKYYEAQVCKRAPLHWAILQQRNVQVIRKPVWLVTGAWEHRDLFFLRESLMSLAVDWEDLFPGSETPCPITFSSKDIEVHAREQENMEGVGQMLKLFRDQAVLPVDGMVDPQDYEITRKTCQKFKDIFIGLAKDDDERELFAKLWPYQSIE